MSKNEIFNSSKNEKQIFSKILEKKKYFTLYYILFYKLIWFESVHFSSTLTFLISNVKDESLPLM